MNPKPNKKLSLGAEFYGTIAWKGFFRHKLCCEKLALVMMLKALPLAHFSSALLC